MSTPGAFRGAAGFYARYRPRYPEALIDDLRARTAGGRLLDLACGTGELALRLCPSFRDVWAVDVEPEMVEVGRANAARIGATNVRWTVCPAEELVVPPGSVDLVTIGSAFHRLDRHLVATRALDWLTRDGALAVPNADSVWQGRERWQEIAVAVVARWTGFGADHAATAAAPRRTHEECLADAGFSRVGERWFEVAHVWTLDDFVGYLYSTSVVVPLVRSGAASGFEADLRAALLAHDPSGRYLETLRFSTILATR